MDYKVVGDTAYALVYKQDQPLTEAQAEALAEEYAKLGVRYKKCVWKGINCVITKAPAAEFEAFCEKKKQNWKSIQERVGYSGFITVKDNTYAPGRLAFTPGPDWNEIVAFIDSNF
ncbi:MAG: hypothetical protein JW871_03265 [Endomicrobiales bacterium]|nr:hypothetical protein [Endomicrobiales bacterium]